MYSGYCRVQPSLAVYVIYATVACAPVKPVKRLGDRSYKQHGTGQRLSHSLFVPAPNVNKHRKRMQRCTVTFTVSASWSWSIFSSLVQPDFVVAMLHATSLSTRNDQNRNTLSDLPHGLASSSLPSAYPSTTLSEYSCSISLTSKP